MNMKSGLLTLLFLIAGGALGFTAYTAYTDYAESRARAEAEAEARALAEAKAKTEGTLRITTDPGDAKIYVNGERKGNSPSEAGQTFAIKLVEGEYTIRAEATVDGNTLEARKDVFVAKGTLQTLSLTLALDTSALKPKDTFRDGKHLPQMMVLAGGRFKMGSPPSEPERQDREGPQQVITITPFAIGVYEVTFKEWDACVADGGCSHRPDDEGWGRGKRPVMNVSWDDTQEYIDWINEKTSGGYRLPTEAEWEYAARAGTVTPFAFGQRITTDQVNSSGERTYNGSAKGIYRGKTMPVGSFASNQWGLYDTHGNVWEWVQDCYRNTLRGQPKDGAAYEGGSCERRVVRGGSWVNSPEFLRSATRGWWGPVYRGTYVGFRLARTLK